MSDDTCTTSAEQPSSSGGYGYVHKGYPNEDEAALMFSFRDVLTEVVEQDIPSGVNPIYTE